MDIPYVYPPNKPKSTEFSPQKSPITYKDLIFMDLNDSKSLLLGSANVTASFWEGSLQVFKDFEDYKESKWIHYYNSSILHCGRFLKNSSSLLVSEGDYYLKILNLPEGIYEPTTVWTDCAEFYETIKGIQFWKGDDRHVLTHSDNHITVWDIKDAALKNIKNYTDYHTDEITSIDTDLSDNRIFFSCGLDGRASIWDSRIEVPASELYLNDFCGLTSISVHPLNPKMVAVGSQSGSVYLIDTLNPKEFLNVQHCYEEAAISKIKFNDLGNMALCGTSKEVQVYDTADSQFNLIYKENTRHVRRVLDLVWQDNSILYTGGLESKVEQHVILPKV